MSKVQEEKNEPPRSNNSNIKPLPSMSSRQQILFLMNKTQSMSNWDIQENTEEEIADYYTYFMKRKEKIRNSWPRHVQLERAKLLKQSLKEFTHIKKNVYIDRKKYAFSDDDAYKCLCEKKTMKKGEIGKEDNLVDPKKEEEMFGCGKTCINRMVSSECVEHLCPSGRSCRNRRFQQHLYSEVFPFKTGERGWGLCAGEFLPKGTFVMQYIGEIYSIDSEYGHQKLKEYKNRTCTYLMEISKKEVIDPTYKGNLARFINHSCEPNCETQKWHVLGEVCVGIFTLRDIQEGEELTFNYGFNILKTTYQKCLCGTSSCKGYLGIVSQNEMPRGPGQGIVCDICKVNCRATEKVLVCENCKKVMHKNCIKKNRVVGEDGITPGIKNKDFICNSCLKKKNLNPTSANLSRSFSTMNISQTQVVTSQGKEKKSSQQLIKEYKNRKKIKDSATGSNIGSSYSGKKNNTESSLAITNTNKNNVSATDPNSNIQLGSSYSTGNILIYPNTEESMSVSEYTERTDLVKEQSDMGIGSSNINLYLKNDSSTVNNKEVETNSIASSSKQKSLRLLEEEFIIDQTVEVEEQDIKKIKLHLPKLSKIGARLFWDYRQTFNSNNIIEIKITGTLSQIEKVKEEIQKIRKEKEVFSEYYSVTLNVPQIFVRKIIGHQNRNLNSYKNKFQVEIDYDDKLITDDIFPIYEQTQITIKGKETQVKAVELDIKKIVNNLKVLTIFLMPADYNFIKMNICTLKTMIDPADVRLRKREYKIDREIKHSFYYVPCTNKDLVVIGFENEIRKGEKIIREFLLRQNTFEHNYSLCFLCPTYFMSLLNNFKNDDANLLRNKNIIIKIHDPVYSRKHLNIYIEGKWKDIVEVKNLMIKYISDNDKNSSGRKKNALSEFEQYTFNQEHKLISKNIKKFLLESSINSGGTNSCPGNNFVIKNWDLISDEIWQVWEAANPPTHAPQSNPCNILNSNSNNPIQSQSGDDDLVKNFVQNNNDRETSLNYLLHLPPGSYNSVFNQNKVDLAKDLIHFVEEAFESYKDKVKGEEKSGENEKFKEADNIIIESDNQISKRSGTVTNVKSHEKFDVELENLTDDENIVKQEKDLTAMDIDTSDDYKTKEKKRNASRDKEREKSEKNIKSNEFSLVNSPSSSLVQSKPTSSFPTNKPVSTTSNPNITNNFSLFNNPLLNSNSMNLQNSLSDIDNIKNTLLNKLNEIKNENKPQNQSQNMNENNSVKSLTSSNSATANKNVEILVSQDDLNLLINKNNPLPTNQPSNAPVVSSINSESMNISYNFSNINQMNININISSFPNEESNNLHDDSSDKQKKTKESKFLRKKTKADRSLSPPVKKGYTKYKERNSSSSNNIEDYRGQSNNSTRYYSNTLGYSTRRYASGGVYESYDKYDRYYDKYSDKYNDKYSEKYSDKYYSKYGGDKYETYSSKYEKFSDKYYDKYDSFDKYQDKYDKYYDNNYDSRKKRNNSLESKEISQSISRSKSPSSISQVEKEGDSVNKANMKEKERESRDQSSSQNVVPGNQTNLKSDYSSYSHRPYNYISGRSSNYGSNYKRSYYGGSSYREKTSTVSNLSTGAPRNYNYYQQPHYQNKFHQGSGMYRRSYYGDSRRRYTSIRSSSKSRSRNSRSPSDSFYDKSKTERVKEFLNLKEEGEGSANKSPDVNNEQSTASSVVELKSSLSRPQNISL